MLPRLRFVVASLVIAILPMVFLGTGLVPPSHPTSPAELSRADRPVVLGPVEYSETQYRLDRIALSYARRENELGKLRALAAAPLANWIAAPTGATPDINKASTEATVTPDGPAVVTANTAKPEKAAEVTASVTAGSTDKADKKPETAGRPSPQVETPSPAAEAEASNPAISKPETAAAAPTADAISDAPRTAAAPPPAGHAFAALNPAKSETSTLPQVHVVAPHKKPRARVARRPKPAAQKPAPAAQKPPPFIELFVWLFNIKPQAPGQPQPSPAAQQKQQLQQQQQQLQQQQQQQQQQMRSSLAPTAGLKTASQP